MKTDILALARPNILKLKPYSTARDECRSSGIDTFLDANESPYENGVNRYPDPRQKALKERLAEIVGVSPSRIFAGNGSDEAIDLLMRIFCIPGKDNVISISPTYGMYSVAAQTNDVEMQEVALNEDFSLNIQALLEAADANSKLLFICSPNNPTGNSFPEEEIEALVKGFGGIVVVDEAYIDFSTRSSMAERIGEFPNLVVLRTLSKAWGMAGLRIGMAIADEEIAGLMAKVKYPYNINILAQQAALERLRPEEKQRHTAEILRERARLASRLESLPEVEKVYPSDANFLLVRFKDPQKTYDGLVDDGIIVRNRNNVNLCGGCLRITIGTPGENESLIACLSGNKPERRNTAEQGKRYVNLRRTTAETDIEVELDLDRLPSESRISTGLNFLDHMLAQIPRHGGFLLNISAKGDLYVDEHHTMEDTAIILGEALDKALGTKKGIERYGFALPMDDCDAMVLLDLGGRIDFKWEVEFTREYIGDIPTEMFRHFFGSLCSAAKCNLHIKATGYNNHHKAEAIFKAFARALRMAVSRSRFPYEIPSSKGLL